MHSCIDRVNLSGFSQKRKTLRQKKCKKIVGVCVPFSLDDRNRAEEQDGNGKTWGGKNL